MKKSAISQQDVEVYLSAQTEQLFQSVDFSDTFSTTNHVHSLERIIRSIFTTQNRWVVYLFQLRNWLVKRLGLKTDMPKDYNERFMVGGYVSFFRIYQILPDEVILGADDQHLNFRVSVCNTNSSENNIKVTTLVQFNNRLGKVYMRIIAPFHRWVLKQMVAQGYNAGKELVPELD